MAKNGLAAAIVDGAMPSGEAGAGPDPSAAAGPSGATGDTQIVAQDMMDAFKAGDTGALVTALDAFKASILSGDDDAEMPPK